MTQVVRTTNEVIVEAFQLLGEVGSDESPAGSMLAQGLYILNELIDDFASDGTHISYVQDLSFTAIQGQSTYSVSNVMSADITADRIVSIEYANYTVSNTLVYPIRIINKSEYYNLVRLTPPTLEARLGYVFLDKQIQQSIINFYPAPDQPYPVDLRCKFMVDQFVANSVITNIPPWVVRFIRYSLTRELKQVYPSGNWPAESEEEYQRLRAKFTQSNDNDMTVRTSAILQSPRPFYWPNIIAY